MILSLGLDRFFEMADCKNRVVKKHPRTGPAHHCADLFAHFRGIAVNAAAGTEGLVFHERARADPLSRIIGQFSALLTELSLGSVMLSAAVEGDHFCDNALFLRALLIDVLHVGSLQNYNKKREHG